jgi:hypothetical protein
VYGERNSTTIGIILRPFGILNSHFCIFCGHVVRISLFGKLYQEKSGKPIIISDCHNLMCRYMYTCWMLKCCGPRVIAGKKDANRVTRFGEFSPIRWLFTLGSFCENCISSTDNLVTFFQCRSYVLIFTKNGLSYILGDFLQTHLDTRDASWVAGFFLVKHTKAGNHVPNNHKNYQNAIKCTKGQ